MAARDITINLRPDRFNGAFIQSYKNGSALLLSSFYREEKVSLRVFFCAPAATGGLSAPLTLATPSAYSCRVGIGFPDGASVLCVETLAWNGTDSCFEGVLNINTTEMNDALDAADGADITKTFEVELKKTGEEFTFQQAVTIKNEVLIAVGGVPEDVTETLFADRLEPRFLDSDTIDVARTGDEFKWHVRRKARGGVGADSDGVFVELLGDAPAILPDLATGFTVSGNAASPTTDSDVVTVGGVAGQLYKIKAHVLGRVERKNHSGGVQTPGDSPHAYRGGTPSADNYNLWYLDISNPPQRIHLNHATTPNTFDIDYLVDFLAYAGASVTLFFDSIDGLSYEANNVAVTQEVAAEAVPDPHGRQTIWVPANAITPRTTDGPASYSAELAANKVMQTAWSFDPDTAQFAQFEVAMPKGWDRGDVFAEILWQSTGGTGDVLWDVQAVAVSDGDALDAAFGTATEVVDTMLGADTLHVTDETAAIVIAGSPAEHDLVTFQVSRNATDGADTFDGDALLKGVRLFYRTAYPTDD